MHNATTFAQLFNIFAKNSNTKNMKKIILSYAFLFAITVLSFGQVSKIVGKWKTIDDKDGSAKSVVFIFKATNGKYYGKIDKLFKEPEKLCTECGGSNKNQPILGMMVINNMLDEDGQLTGGTILDPKNGKIYKCNIKIDSDDVDKLSVRGSLDRGGLIGRSQTWIRLK
jgi:uncharacterized protein (DUF2147 family)